MITCGPPPRPDSKIRNVNSKKLRCQNIRPSSLELPRYTYDRKNLALSPDASIVELEVLSQDDDWSVRRSVAMNPHSPPAVLAVLAQDVCAVVRYYVACNPSTSREVKSLLVDDIDEQVRRVVVS